EEGEIRICLLGSKKRVEAHAKELGFSSKFHQLVEVVNPLADEHASSYSQLAFELRKRKGVSRTGADELMRNHNYFAAMMLKTGRCDGLVSGIVEPYARAARPILEMIGTGGRTLAGIYMIMVGSRQYFFADCTINIAPDAPTLADIAITTAKVAQRYTQEKPRVAMLSFASFGATRH